MRFFCVFVFSLLGWRAKHPEKPKRFSSSPLQYYVVLKWQRSFKDKICLSHFVTPSAYRLSPPHNEYWKNLYQSLVPVYGEPETIQEFFDANADWTGPVRGSEGSQLASASNGMAGYVEKYLSDPRYKYQKKGLIARMREWILGGWFGDQLEKLKFIQIYFIKRSLKNAGYKPRIIFNDNELEFHPDTKRIELLLEKSKNKL